MLCGLRAVSVRDLSCRFADGTELRGIFELSVGYGFVIQAVKAFGCWVIMCYDVDVSVQSSKCKLSSEFLKKRRNTPLCAPKNPPFPGDFFLLFSNKQKVWTLKNNIFQASVFLQQEQPARLTFGRVHQAVIHFYHQWVGGWLNQHLLLCFFLIWMIWMSLLLTCRALMLKKQPGV